MQDWIVNMINQFGYVGIALLIAIENIFPPIPSEVVLTFGGFMTTRSDMNIWLVSLSATLGSVTGAVVLFYIGKLIPAPRLARAADRWGRILRIKTRDLIKAKLWFDRRGSLTVFICRFIPVVRSLISIPAGMAHMKIGKFLLYTTLGTAVWNMVWVYLGALAGENWESILNYLNTYSYVLAISGICFVICFSIIKRAVRRNSHGNGGRRRM